MGNYITSAAGTVCHFAVEWLNRQTTGRVTRNKRMEAASQPVDLDYVAALDTFQSHLPAAYDADKRLTGR